MGGPHAFESLHTCINVHLEYTHSEQYSTMYTHVLACRQYLRPSWDSNYGPFFDNAVQSKGPYKVLSVYLQVLISNYKVI